ncbi:hypothetical protein ACNKHU_17225 [Shigella flexneri]
MCGAMVGEVIEFGQDLEAIPAGGGLSVPYQQGAKRRLRPNIMDGLWNAARVQIARHFGYLRLEIVNGSLPVAQSRD